MRRNGKITTWKDDQGFGFITPHAGGEPVFVHVRAFANRTRRPAGNEIVSFGTEKDSRGRLRAVNVAFVGERAATTSRGGVATVLVFSFTAFVTGLAVTGKLPFIIPGIYVIASLLAVVLYAKDKSAARRGVRRTPENTLHVIGLLGGWPGALVAQKFLRHKSRKIAFQVMFWITVILNGAALYWLLTPEGGARLRAVLDRYSAQAWGFFGN